MPTSLHGVQPGSIEIEIQKLHGEPGLGCHRLRVDLKVSAAGYPPNMATLISLSGDLQVQRQAGRLFVSACHTSIGTPLPLNMLTRPTSVSLYFDLASRSLLELESHRAGGDLKVQLFLRSLAFSTGHFSSPACDMTHTEPQSSWCSILSSMGFDAPLMFEVSLSGYPEGSELIRAAEHLATAVEHLRAGKWMESVAACRKCLDALKAHDKGLRTVTHLTDTEATLPHRLSGIWTAVRHCCHLAVHDEPDLRADAFDFATTRELVMLTAALLGHYGDKIALQRS
ncbi:MAG: hypothetical protein ACT4PU_00615 [Planctomycetota bacterium]